MPTREASSATNGIASFVVARYAHTEDILRTGWLSIAERHEYNTIEWTIKAIHETKWPEINKLDFPTCDRSLQSSKEHIEPSKVPRNFKTSPQAALLRYLVLFNRDQVQQVLQWR